MLASVLRLTVWGAFVLFCFYYAATTLIPRTAPSAPPASHVSAPLETPTARLPEPSPLPGPKVEPVNPAAQTKPAAKPKAAKPTTRKKAATSKRGRPVTRVIKKEDQLSDQYRFFFGSQGSGTWPGDYR